MTTRKRSFTTRMKLSRLIIIAACLAFVRPVLAQDVIRSVNGEEFRTRVRSMDKHDVKFDYITGAAGNTFNKLPRNYVSSIDMEDGFTINFTPEGEVIRDNLLDAPAIKSIAGYIYAEGLVRYTEEETRIKLGNETYSFAYKPAKARLTLAYAQIISGAAMMTYCVLTDKKHVWFRDDRSGLYFSGMSIGSLDALEIVGRTWNKGDINAWLVGLEFLSVSTVACGLVNIIAPSGTVKKIVSGNYAAPTLGQARAKFWTGIGTMAAGAGAMAYGMLDMNSKHAWDFDTYPESLSWHNVHEGEMPVAGAIIAFTGGMLLNVGLTMFVSGSASLRHTRRGIPGCP